MKTMFALKLWLVSFCSTISVDDGILPNITCQYHVRSEDSILKAVLWIGIVLMLILIRIKLSILMPDPDLVPSFSHVLEKLRNNFTSVHRSAGLYCFALAFSSAS
jgi:hypothetical protein